jgi:energy-coupling factor transport system permease protein
MAKAYNTYVSKNTFIEKINPNVKIWAIFSFGLSALIFPNSYLGFALIIVLFILAFISKIFKSFTKIMLGFGIPITIMLIFIQGFYGSKNVTVLYDFGSVQLYLEGVLHALKIVSSLLVFLGTFYIMNHTTYTGKLVASLTASGVNPKVGYLVLASLNVVPQMQRKLSVIQEAQTARGVEKEGSLLHRFKVFVPLLGPVVLSSLTDAQERGMTLETRGFGIKNVKQTHYVEVSYTKVDRIIKYLLIGFLVVVLIITILMKLSVI